MVAFAVVGVVFAQRTRDHRRPKIMTIAPATQIEAPTTSHRSGRAPSTIRSHRSDAAHSAICRVRASCKCGINTRQCVREEHQTEDASTERPRWPAKPNVAPERKTAGDLEERCDDEIDERHTFRVVDGVAAVHAIS